MNETPRYFALGRLLNRWRGGNATRSEGNWREAYLAGAAMYAVSYLTVVEMLRGRLLFWQMLVALPLLLLALWFVWLIVVYLNSLMGRGCWAIGIATELSRRRVQSVLIGIELAVCAAWLLGRDSSLRWFGFLWLVATGLNLAAAFLLAIWYDERD